MFKLSLTNVATAIFVMYIAHSMHSIYTLFHPPLCRQNQDDKDCLIVSFAVFVYERIFSMKISNVLAFLSGEEFDMADKVAKPHSFGN